VVVLVGQQRLQLDAAHVLLELEEALVGLLEQILVAGFFGHLVRERGLFERVDHLGQRLDLGLEQLDLVDDLACLVLVGPEIIGPHPRFELREVLLTRVVVKESRGSSRSAPQDR
jgi:hypothetical protein